MTSIGREAATADFTLGDFIEKAARLWGDRAALVHRNSTVTFEGFRDRVLRLQTVLESSGVGQDSRIALLSDNSPAYFELFFACAGIGATLVPLNIRLSWREVAYQVDNADISHCVLNRAFAELAERSGLTNLAHWWLDGSYEEAIASTEPMRGRRFFPPQTAVSQMYTSGTTGFAKGCIHTQGGWRMSMMNLSLGMRIDRKAVALVQAPLFHAWGLGYSLSHLYMGSTLVFPNSNSPADYWEAIDNFDVTSASVPPTPPPTPEPRPNVTILTSQAGGLRRSARTLRDEYFPNAEIYGVYGMTELTNIAIMSRAWEEVENPGTMGEPFAGVQFEVHDPEGNPVGRGDIGQLVIRTSQACAGYYKDPEATADLFKGGWLHTGDLVLVDERGDIHFQDRAKDMIKTGGENVYSAEVERVLLDHPGVADAAVFGVPDERWGEAVKAVVIFRSQDVTIEQLDAFCLEHIAAYKRPRWYEVAETLPRNGTGKVVKTKLRELHDPRTSIRLGERS